MARTPIIAGNWKMNKGTAAEASAAGAMKSLPLLKSKSGVTVVVCPPYTVLHMRSVQSIEGFVRCALGAQDAFWKTIGSLHKPGLS